MQITQERKKKWTKIQCEYCNATILLYHKQLHFAKCSTKKQMDAIKEQLFYDEDVNVNGDYKQAVLISVSNEHLTQEQFIEKLLKKYKQMSESLTPLIVGKTESFEAIKSIYLKTHRNKKKLKHCKQIELIIYHIHKAMESLQLSENYFLFELGAGKGVLGAIFHRFVNKFLFIVDINSKYKTKADNRLKDKKRVQCGLQHFNLNKLSLRDEDGKERNECIAFSKHLCGKVTDFGLRCIVNAQQNINCPLIGIAMCCRSLCSFETYCNVQYLMNGIKLIENKQEFEYLRKMCHWGIGDQNNEKRNEIGYICRRFIDEGRVKYLQQNGYKNVKLIQYCSDTITKENTLLIATKKMT